MRIFLILLTAIAIPASAGLFSNDFVPAKKAVSEVQSHQAVFLDVREPAEYTKGEVKGALSFPMSKVGSPEWQKFLATLPKDKPVYTYCERGYRASKVAEELRKHGFKAESAGGLNDLRGAGATLK